MNGRRNEVFFLLWHCCCHQLSVNKSFNSAGWIVLTMFGLLIFYDDDFMFSVSLSSWRLVCCRTCQCSYFWKVQGFVFSFDARRTACESCFCSVVILCVYPLGLRLCPSDRPSHFAVVDNPATKLMFTFWYSYLVSVFSCSSSFLSK